MPEQILINYKLKKRLEVMRDKLKLRGLGQAVEYLYNKWEKDNSSVEDLLIDHINKFDSSISKPIGEYIALFNAFLRNKTKSGKIQILKAFISKVEEYEND